MQVIANSLTKQTRGQYTRYIKAFQLFCASSKGINFRQASIHDGVDYLDYLFHEGGTKYPGLNQARSALSLVINTGSETTFGNTNIVKRYLAGAFKLKPTFPRYTTTFDASLVLSHLKCIHNDTAPLKELSFKLITLLSLLTGKRKQSLAALHTDCMARDAETLTFFIPVVLKMTAPGKHIPPLELKKYPYDPALCPVTLIDVYLERTSIIRNNEPRLFLSYRKPHKAVGSTTLARWCTETLKMAGIDVTIFKAHSTRGAATSKASAKGLSLRQLNNAVGWSDRSETFARFYKKPIHRNLGETILKD